MHFDFRGNVKVLAPRLQRTADNELAMTIPRIFSEHSELKLERLLALLFVQVLSHQDLNFKMLSSSFHGILEIGNLIQMSAMMTIIKCSP
ncbi:hypothetical protein DPMN_167852 [Dreissena polymorpha]|uniref:Uncharacterized protein n=1 Tax=Dreissena polymorpha TaxID=45954 RepID=A0A9D4IVD9_DREPO|nr:hypothetical protein DPMN_167852 [Dreissena polymorpha]